MTKTMKRRAAMIECLESRKLLAAGPKTKQQFTNYSMHCEFLLPFKPLGRGQDRGNSGVYMQDRYEVPVVNRMKKPWDMLDGATFRTSDPQYHRWSEQRKGVYTSNGALLCVVQRSGPNRMSSCRPILAGYLRVICAVPNSTSQKNSRLPKLPL